MARTAPRYDLLFDEGNFKCTLLIGPDPLGANFDYSVFLEARRRLRTIGLRLNSSKRGFEEYETEFDYNNEAIRARVRLYLGNFTRNMQDIWRETLSKEDFVYLKTHAGYGSHLSLSNDVNYFTEAMKNGVDRNISKTYQVCYLDCCKSEMYYRDVFRNYVGNCVDLILNKWFCDYRKIGPAVVLIRELMEGSDFGTIVRSMNEEYGTVHIDVEDDPADIRPDRKMVTYSLGNL